MIGHRGKLAGEEWDAFSRRSRHILHWHGGQIAKLKRAYAKRVRKSGRLAALREIAQRPGRGQ